MLDTLTLLYIEDDQSTAHAFLKGFETEFKTVWIAYDGEEGLSMFQKHLPDIVMTDLQIPKMNGLDLIQQLRESNPKIPVIVNSAFSDAHLLLRSIELGVDHYLLKPTHPQKLMEMFERTALMINAKKMEENHRHMLQTIIDEVPDPILYILPDRTVPMMNNAAREQGSEHWGNEPFNKCYEISHGRSEPCIDRSHPCPLEYVLRMKKPMTLRHVHLDPSGKEHQVDVHARPIFDHEGKVVACLEVTHDMTEYLEMQNELIAETQKLAHISLHDPLTQLPNRKLLMDRIAQEIAHKSREKTSFALLFIDLDHFKEVNDSLGHLVGDQLLIQVAQRLQSVLRKEDTVARIGGDEFVLIINDGSENKHFIHVAEKIERLFDEPFVVDNQLLSTGCSIGISVYPIDGTSAETLLSNADAAMYASKHAGRHQFRFYSPEMTQNAYNYINMSKDLKKAMEENEFFLLFQPFFSPAENRFTSAEALIRWNHPERGIVNPSEFLPVARKAGLIPLIDFWVLEKACEGFHRISHEKPHLLNTFSLNVSVETLMHSDFVDTVARMIKKYALPPSSMIVEVIENQIMDDVLGAKKVFRRLHDLGVLISLDDFGTGYSSLSYLLDFKVDVLKIDASFIRRIDSDDKSISLIKSILSLSKTLSLTSVAEGVETQIQKDFLINEEVDFIQGYYYSLPVEIDSLKLLLDTAPTDKEAL